MTPEQLEELEIWLAAGFDLPTAMAAVQGEDDHESPGPSLDSPRAKPSAWQVILCVILALAAMWLVLR